MQLLQHTLAMVSAATRLNPSTVHPVRLATVMYQCAACPAALPKPLHENKELTGNLAYGQLHCQNSMMIMLQH
jgi:hypothetical protein